MEIKCQDCGEVFTFSTEEQKFYKEKGFYPPKRCKNCRRQRKQNNYNNERRNSNG